RNLGAESPNLNGRAVPEVHRSLGVEFVQGVTDVAFTASGALEEEIMRGDVERVHPVDAVLAPCFRHGQVGIPTGVAGVRGVILYLRAPADRSRSLAQHEIQRRLRRAVDDLGAPFTADHQWPRIFEYDRSAIEPLMPVIPAMAVSD